MEEKPKKTRVYISFNTSTVERWRSLSKHFGMPASVLSNCLDEVLEGLCELMEEAKREGKMDIEMLRKLMGAQMEKAEQIEELKVKGETQHEETEKKCPDCGRPWHRFHNCEINPVANPKPKLNPVSR